jgi:hypothetical protein
VACEFAVRSHGGGISICFIYLPSLMIDSGLLVHRLVQERITGNQNPDLEGDTSALLTNFPTARGRCERDVEPPGNGTEVRSPKKSPAGGSLWVKFPNAFVL